MIEAASLESPKEERGKPFPLVPRQMAAQVLGGRALAQVPGI